MSGISKPVISMHSRTLKICLRSYNILLTAFTLLLISCTPKMFKGLKSADDSFSAALQLFKPGMKESLVYKTVVHFRDKEFSSLTYVNAVNDSVFKIVLLTTFGNTLLESEISKHKFTVNNVNSYLDRKLFLKLFESDWRLLLESNFTDEKPMQYSDGQDQIVFDYGTGSTNHLFYFSKSKGAVSGIESFKGKKKKVVVRVDSFSGIQPEKFSIDHPSLNLSFNFTLLKKVGNETGE